MSERKQYRRRDTRQKAVNDRPLSPRELQILQALDQFRVMSQAQVHQLCFAANKSKTPSTRTLASLFDRKYVDRILLPVAAGRGATVYLIDRRGVEAIAGEDTRFYGTYKDIKNDYIHHLLAVAEMRILVTEACKQHGFGLEWIPEHTFHAPGHYDKVTLDGKPTGVVPDGAFCITHQGRKSIFFLELDRVTTRLERYRNKLRAYLLYARSDAYFARFGNWLTEEQRARRMPSMRVLTVVSSDSIREQGGAKRLENLVSQVNHPAVVELRPARRFWFARLPDLTPENILSVPVWRVKLDESSDTLLEEFDQKGTYINKPQTD